MISIHPPRAGRDLLYTTSLSANHTFQSTRPVRGGTIYDAPRELSEFISIHPPRAGRDMQLMV